jgi:hypothetical protein
MRDSKNGRFPWESFATAALRHVGDISCNLPPLLVLVLVSKRVQGWLWEFRATAMMYNLAPVACWCPAGEEGHIPAIILTVVVIAVSTVPSRKG